MTLAIGSIWCCPPRPSSSGLTATEIDLLLAVRSARQRRMAPTHRALGCSSRSTSGPVLASGMRSKFSLVALQTGCDTCRARRQRQLRFGGWRWGVQIPGTPAFASRWASSCSPEGEARQGRCLGPDRRILVPRWRTSTVRSRADHPRIDQARLMLEHNVLGLPRGPISVPMPELAPLSSDSHQPQLRRQPWS